MKITDVFILAKDVMVIPAEELNGDTLRQCTADSGCFFVSRPNSRTLSSVVSEPVAAVLESLRSPKTLIQVALEFCLQRGGDPEQVIESVVAALGPYIAKGWIAPPDSINAEELVPTLTIGDTFGDYLVSECAQILEDSEVYQVTRADGTLAALKISRPDASDWLRGRFRSEAAVLRAVNGRFAPALIEEAVEGDASPYLVMQWVPGAWATKAADEIHALGGIRALGLLLDLCLSIVRAYEHLHEQGILHGDVYPKNVLVDERGGVSLVDFGASSSLASEGGPKVRAGVPEYFEPEIAKQELAGLPRGNASERGEQYAIAVLLFRLLTGRFYLDLSPVKEETMRQIVESPPLRLDDVGIHASAELQDVFDRALRKDPEQRFASVAELRRALERVRVGLQAPDAEPRLSRGGAGASFDWFSLDPSLALPADVPTSSLSFGAAGVAFALHAASIVLREPKLLSMALAWAERADRQLALPGSLTSASCGIDEQTIGFGSVWFGAPGVHLTRALVAHAACDHVGAISAMDGYREACHAATISDDLTIGRAGHLLGYAQILDAIRHPGQVAGYGADARFNDIALAGHEKARELIAGLQRVGTSDSHYLGMAHGIAGALYALMTWFEVAGDPIPALIEMRLHELAACGKPGNPGLWFPISPRNAQSRLESWCHGTPGYVFLWSIAYRLTRDVRFRSLAERTAWTAWEAESDAESLCCGNGGRAYAMLEMARLTGDRVWLTRAHQACKQSMRRLKAEDRLSHALYKGALGPRLLELDLYRPEQASMPVMGRNLRHVF